MRIPVSSNISLRAHSSMDSLNSRWPPGNAQVPSPWEFLRLPRRTLLFFITITATPMRGLGFISTLVVSLNSDSIPFGLFDFCVCVLWCYSFKVKKSSGIWTATTSPRARILSSADSVTEITILRPLLSTTRPRSSSVLSTGVGAR